MPVLGPHATDTVSSELWQKIATLSAEKSLPIHSHLAQSAEEYKRIQQREACSPVEFLQKNSVLEKAYHALLVHGVFLSDKDLSLFSKKDQTLVFCPFSQLIFAFPASVHNWENKNLRWTVATDCVANNDSMNLQKELRYLSGFLIQRISYRDDLFKADKMVLSLIR